MTCPGLYAARAGIIVTNELPAGATKKALAGKHLYFCSSCSGLPGCRFRPASTPGTAACARRSACCPPCAGRRALRHRRSRRWQGTRRYCGGGKDPVGPAAYCPLAPVAYRPMPARPGRVFAGSVGMTMNGRGAILPPRPGRGRARLTQLPFRSADPPHLRPQPVVAAPGRRSPRTAARTPARSPAAAPPRPAEGRAALWTCSRAPAARPCLGAGQSHGTPAIPIQ